MKHFEEKNMKEHLKHFERTKSQIKIVILLLYLFVNNINATQILSGKLSDKETAKPIEAAYVELLRLPDSLSVEVIATRTDGYFSFNKVDSAKTYCLRIKHIGYKTLIISVNIQQNNTAAISLEPAINAIKEVIINGSKVNVTELADRTIYGMPDDMKKTSTDGLDVLRKVPSVLVNYFDEKITVDGKSNIKIEVDGVPRNSAYLKRLHPSEIDKLEIITSPSGKYDASVDAVINVVTNPEMRYGLKSTINAQILPNSKDVYLARFNGSLDYGLKKISYYIALNGGIQNFNFISNIERITNNNLLQRRSSQFSEGYNGNVNIGLIYDPDRHNNLNFNIWYNGQHTVTNGDNLNYNSENNVMQQIYETTTKSNNNGGTLHSLFFFKHRYDKKTQHGYEIEANYYNTPDNNYKTKYQNINYATDTLELSRGPFLNEESKTHGQNINFQANYTLPFDSVYTLHLGIGGDYYKSNVFNLASLTDAPNLDYRDLKGSFFGELSKSFKKGSLKAGTRIETNSVNINSTNKNKYLAPLPYASGLYKFNARNNLKLTYSRRIIRPSSSQLNPFVSAVDSLTIRHGNINLKPAYTDNFQLTYNLKYGKSKFSGSLSPHVFYDYKTRIIQNVISLVANSNISEIVPQNISNGYLTGVGLTMYSQINKIMFNSSFKYYYFHISKYQNLINENLKQGWSWNSYAVCPLPHDLRLFATLNMNGPSLNGQLETKTSPMYVVGLVKQFKNNSALNMMFLNFFADKYGKTVTTLNSSEFYQRTESYWELKKVIMFSYIYNFKIGKAIDLKKRDAEESREETNTNLPL